MTRRAKRDERGFCASTEWARVPKAECTAAEAAFESNGESAAGTRGAAGDCGGGAGATSSNTTSGWSGSMRRKLGCAGSGAGAAMASVSSKTSSGGSGAG